MATVVGTLIFEMAADVARLRSDMAKAQSTVSSTMTGIKDAAGIAVRALGALGVGLSAVAFSEMVKSSAEAIEHMRDLGIKTGNTTEAMYALMPAVRAAGGDIGQAAKALQFLSKNMLTAADSGKGPAAAAFRELGISVSDASGKLRNNAEVMQEVAEKLTAMDDRTRAVALAKQLLGKAGAELLPVLEEMARLGKQESAITNEQGESAHQFMLELRLLEARSTSLKREFTIGLLPALNAIGAALLDTSSNAEGARGAGEAVGQVMRWVAQAVTGAWTAFELLGKSIGTVTAALVMLQRGDWKGAVAALKEGMADIGKTAEAAADRIKKMGEEAAKLPAPRRGGRTAGGGGSEGGTNETESEDGQSFAPRGAASLAGGYGALLAQAAGVNRVLRDTREVGGDVGEILERAGIRGARGMSSLKDVLRNVIAQLLEMARVQMTSGGGGGIGGLITSGLGGLIGDTFAGYFAKGGTIPAGSYGVVGENGPELVSGGAGGTGVTPLALGGGGDVNVYVTNHIDARGGGDQGAVNRLAARLPGMIAEQSVAAVRAYMNARGRSFA